jgi:hypothetical protein
LASATSAWSHDAEQRTAILDGLRAKLAQGDKALVGNSGFRRYLKAVSARHFAIDDERVAEAWRIHLIRPELRKIRRSLKTSRLSRFFPPLAGERNGRTTVQGRPLDLPSLLERPLAPCMI